MDWEGFFTHYRKPGFIPGYEIVNKLGSGVFGEVFKARKESIGKFYAIKFLKVSDEKISEAIFKELDSLRHFAQLDHPNLVSIEDQGEVMGIPYIVMGYGGDETLKKLLAREKLSEQRIDDVFGQVLGGVGELHRSSIIHFDLKPANVFMKDDHARVGDYGLSKLVSESHNTMSIGRGTPYYMAPEMLRRRGDHQSDLYSLGVILFEMVTGEVPFQGDTEWEVLKKHESAALEIPAGVPARYAAAIEGAMQKDPAQRFESADAMFEVFMGKGAHPGGPVLGTVEEFVTGQVGTKPPPLPPMHLRRGREAARRVQTVVRRITEKGGVVVGKAKDEINRQRVARKKATEVPVTGEKTHLDESFHADFEEPDLGLNDGFVDPMDPKPAVVKRGVVSKFFRGLIWPLKMLFKLIGVFFRNFFRYLIVLAITVGICVLVHGAIYGFDHGF